MAAYDDLNAKRIYVVGILSVLVTIVAALAVQVVYFWMVDMQTTETAAESDYRRQNQILAEQQAEISTYGVDPLTGNIVIPIGKAIDLMVDQQATDAADAKPAADAAETESETSEET